MRHCNIPRQVYINCWGLQHTGHCVAGGAVPDDADVLQDRADLAATSLNRSERDADAAQKEYVKSLVTRSDMHSLSQFVNAPPVNASRHV